MTTAFLKDNEVKKASVSPLYLVPAMWGGRGNNYCQKCDVKKKYIIKIPRGKNNKNTQVKAVKANVNNSIPASENSLQKMCQQDDEKSFQTLYLKSNIKCSFDNHFNSSVPETNQPPWENRSTG